MSDTSGPSLPADPVLQAIGSRLREARDAKNATGPAVAAAAASAGHFTMNWTRLRDFETGQDVPSTDQAQALAKVLGTSLGLLLGEAPIPRRAAPTSPVRKTGRDPDLEHPIAERLQRKGFNPGHAVEFVRYGIPDGMVKRWLDHFTPEEALAWIALGEKPYGARTAAKNGETPASRWRERDEPQMPPLPEPTAQLHAAGVAREVAVFWTTHANAAAGLAWHAAGWDLLSAYAWIDTGLSPKVALRWHQAGIRPGDYPAVSSLVADPEEAGRWHATALPLDQWGPWLARHFSPEEAAVWSSTRMSAAEAAEYRRLVGDAGRAGWYRSLGLSAHAASRWEATDLGWTQTQMWVARGVEPAEARFWQDRGIQPDQVVPLEEISLDLDHLGPWVEAGFGPAEITQWASRGFDLSAAIEWRPLGPERAQRQRRFGITSAHAVARSERGRMRRGDPDAYAKLRPSLFPRDDKHAATAAATPVLDEELPDPAHRTTATAPRPDSVCGSCGQPIRVDGGCGCST